jgi:hypothetical protein
VLAPLQQHACLDRQAAGPVGRGRQQRQGVAPSGATGAARTTVLAAGQRQTGAGSAAGAQPRHLTARRSGTTLVVAWQRGAVAVRGYAVTVAIGPRTVRLLAAPGHPGVTVRGLSKARTQVRVALRARRLDGRLGAVVRLVVRR